MRRLIIILLILLSFVPILHAEDEELPEARIVLWHPSGDYLAIASNDGLRLYDSQFSLLTYIESPPIIQISWSPDGTMLLVHYSEGSFPSIKEELELFQFSEASLLTQQLDILKDNPGESTFGFGFAWKPDSNRFLVVNTGENSFSIYDLDGNETAFGEQDFDLTTSVDWHPDGSMIAIEARAEGVTLWDAASGEYLRMLPYSAEGLLASGIHFNSDGSEMLAGTVIPASIHVWELETGDYVFEPDTSADVSYIAATEWSPDNRFVVYDVKAAESCRFGGIVIADTSTWAQEDDINVPLQTCDSWFDLSPDGSFLTILGFDGYVYNWEIGAETVTKVEGIQFASIPIPA